MLRQFIVLVIVLFMTGSAWAGTEWSVDKRISEASGLIQCAMFKDDLAVVLTRDDTAMLAIVMPTGDVTPGSGIYIKVGGQRFRAPEHRFIQLHPEHPIYDAMRREGVLHLAYEPWPGPSREVAIDITGFNERLEECVSFVKGW